jgi:pimeloyl-ACP methyl ester carboxylesterase
MWNRLTAVTAVTAVTVCDGGDGGAGDGSGGDSGGRGDGALARRRLASGGVRSTFTPLHRGGSGSPLVCVHGFTDTWRTWELVLAELERRHEVLAPTLAGHAGGPPIVGEAGESALVDALEQAMDDVGFEHAHIVGNSLGGYLALQLAVRGRAESVVALAPAGGWAEGDEAFGETVAYFKRMRAQLTAAAPNLDRIVSTVEGRRLATQYVATSFEHIPAELIAHQMLGVVRCDALDALIEGALRDGWHVEAERIACPVRIVWGTADRILTWPSAGARFREDWLPNADWVELDGVGHCPQLDVPLETAQLVLGFTAG